MQGVGFRWWVRSRALELGLVGFARNMEDGRVEICAQGEREAILTLQEKLNADPRESGRPGAIDSMTIQWAEPRSDLSGFRER